MPPRALPTSLLDSPGLHVLPVANAPHQKPSVTPPSASTSPALRGTRPAAPEHARTEAAIHAAAYAHGAGFWAVRAGARSARPKAAAPEVLVAHTGSRSTLGAGRVALPSCLPDPQVERCPSRRAPGAPGRSAHASCSAATAQTRNRLPLAPADGGSAQDGCARRTPCA